MATAKQEWDALVARARELEVLTHNLRNIDNQDAVTQEDRNAALRRRVELREEELACARELAARRDDA